VLVGLAAAVAENARDLLADAELLLGAGRWARAYSLALLAAEEWAKAYAVITVSFMPAAVNDANVAKQRGLYADLLANGKLSLPSEVTEGEAAKAVARAREVGASAVLLHDQDALAKFADPPAAALDLAAVVFGRYLDMDVADADADAAALTDMAGWFQDGEPPHE
jgi:hypothetical protein